MPRRVKFVGRDTSNPERPMLVYQAEGTEEHYRVPEEVLNSPGGAAAAAAKVGGYEPVDPGPDAQYDTAATFQGYSPTTGKAAYENVYAPGMLRLPQGGPDEMRASRAVGGQNARLYAGPPSPEQTKRTGMLASPPSIKGPENIQADMQMRAKQAASDRHAAAVARLRADLGLDD